MSSLHETVRQEIVKRIHENVYDVATPLPSTAALAEEFGVSAITIKRALRDLQPTGLLRSVPGLGTFVRERRKFIRDLDHSLTSLDDAKRLGLRSEIRLISITREKITEPAFDPLAPPKETMLCVRKVISVDALPIMVDTTFLPRDVDERAAELFDTNYVVDALRRTGATFSKTKLVIDAAPASKEAQEAFNIANGYPTLRRLYRLSADNRDLTLFGVTESPFDRLACTIELDAPRRFKRATGAVQSKAKSKRG